MSTTTAARLALVGPADDGHRAFIEDGGWIRVRSDSYQNKSYRVEFHAIERRDGQPVVFLCAPIGPSRDDHGTTRSHSPGVVPCKHAAVAARLLETAGLVELNGDGRWIARLPDHVHVWADGRCDCGQPEDPFEGLPLVG